MHLRPPPPPASDAVRSKAVVLLLLILCFLLLPLFLCGWGPYSVLVLLCSTPY